ncbi:MAG: hypothetical protein WAU88_03855 [Candidatus Zixiibacteriota bacterium]
MKRKFRWWQWTLIVMAVVMAFFTTCTIACLTLGSWLFVGRETIAKTELPHAIVSVQLNNGGATVDWSQDLLVKPKGWSLIGERSVYHLYHSGNTAMLKALDTRVICYASLGGMSGSSVCVNVNSLPWRMLKFVVSQPRNLSRDDAELINASATLPCYIAQPNGFDQPAEISMDAKPGHTGKFILFLDCDSISAKQEIDSVLTIDILWNSGDRTTGLRIDPRETFPGIGD